MEQIAKPGNQQPNTPIKLNLDLATHLRKTNPIEAGDERDKFAQNPKNPPNNLSSPILSKSGRFSDQPFGALKNGTLWNAPGFNTTTHADGSKITDLGNGVTRTDRPDGSSTIKGLKLINTPITQNIQGNNESWLVDPKLTSQQMENDALLNLKLGPTSIGEFNFNGKKISYRQFQLGPNGTQYSRLEFSDERTVHIYSSDHLPTNSLQNIAKILQEDPPQTFKTINGIFIRDKVGEIRGPDGAIQLAGGFYDPSTRNVFLRSEDIKTPENTQFVLDHEAGHSIDFASIPYRSDFYKSADGKKLFGNGTLVKNSSGGVDLSQSDYVSEYASRVGIEDWAETHRVAFKIRQEFNAAHPSHEFFTLPAAALDTYLDNKLFSPGIKMKIQAVSDYYRHFYLNQPAGQLPVPEQIPSPPKTTHLLRG